MTSIALLLLVGAVVLILAGIRGESLVADLSKILKGGKP